MELLGRWWSRRGVPELRGKHLVIETLRLPPGQALDLQAVLTGKGAVPRRADGSPWPGLAALIKAQGVEQGGKVLAPNDYLLVLPEAALHGFLGDCLGGERLAAELERFRAGITRLVRGRLQRAGEPVRCAVTDCPRLAPDTVLLVTGGGVRVPRAGEACSWRLSAEGEDERGNRRSLTVRPYYVPALRGGEAELVEVPPAVYGDTDRIALGGSAAQAPIVLSDFFASGTPRVLVDFAQGIARGDGTHVSRTIAETRQGDTRRFDIAWQGDDPGLRRLVLTFTPTGTRRATAAETAQRVSPPLWPAERRDSPAPSRAPSAPERHEPTLGSARPMSGDGNPTLVLMRPAPQPRMPVPEPPSRTEDGGATLVLLPPLKAADAPPPDEANDDETLVTGLRAASRLGLQVDGLAIPRIDGAQRIPDLTRCDLVIGADGMPVPTSAAPGTRLWTSAEQNRLWWRAADGGLGPVVFSNGRADLDGLVLEAPPAELAERYHAILPLSRPVALALPEAGALLLGRGGSDGVALPNHLLAATTVQRQGRASGTLERLNLSRRHLRLEVVRDGKLHAALAEGRSPVWRLWAGRVVDQLDPGDDTDLALDEGDRLLFACWRLKFTRI